jgi:hypothetical protein
MSETLWRCHHRFLSDTLPPSYGLFSSDTFPSSYDRLISDTLPPSHHRFLSDTLRPPYDRCVNMLCSGQRRSGRTVMQQGSGFSSRYRRLHSVPLGGGESPSHNSFANNWAPSSLVTGGETRGRATELSSSYSFPISVP